MDQWWQNLIAKNLKTDITTQPGPYLDSGGEDMATVEPSGVTPGHIGNGQDGDECDVWTPTQHPLLKLSMVLMTLAFLVPPKRGNKYMVMLFRAFMTASTSAGVVWGVHTCSPDVIIWNFLFLGVNVSHLLYSVYRVVPARLTEDAQAIYERYFQPHKVSRKSFITLRTSAWQCDLDAGHEYFSEGSRGAAQNISLLVRGRLVVTHQGTYLHDIRPLEFVDSLEWQWRDRNEDRLETRFQVTVTASEESALLCWHMRDMESIKSNDLFAYTVFDHVVSMDAVGKLYRCASGSQRSRAIFANKSPFHSRRPNLSTIDSIEEEDDESVEVVHKKSAVCGTSGQFLEVPVLKR